MRLFVKSSSGRKLYLGPAKATRKELAEYFGCYEIRINDHGGAYHVNDVMAEKSPDFTLLYVIFVGFFAHIYFGMWLVTSLACFMMIFIGMIRQSVETESVDKFNKS